MRELDAAQREAVAALENYNAVLDSGADNMDELSEAEERNQRAAERLAEADAKASKAAEKLSDATEEAANAAEKSGRKSEKAITQLSGALAAAGVVQMVHKIADAFMEASEAAAFETGVAKVSTIADTSRISMGEITSQISALSRETGQSVTGLSEAVYSAISASVDTASAVQFTGTATKLAAGGFTAASTAVDVLTTALNAYGLSADKASNISDMLITTQNLGKTSVDELAASVGKVIPLAAAYGVEMDNLSAAYAELTKGGIATAEAGTYLKSMLSERGDSGSTVIAGEKRRELIVRKADAYAVGTTDSSNYYIAGENGPELIIGQQGSKVFPHEETEKIIRELNRTERTADYRNAERDFRSTETVRPLVILSPSEKIREAGRERESAFHTDRTERITEKALEVRESVANETSVLNQLVSRVERVAALETPEIPPVSSESRIATAFPSEPESVTRLMKSDASLITRTIVTLIPVMVYQAAERLAAQIAASDSGESLSLITNSGTLSAPESVTLAERAEQSAAPFRIADADERAEPVTEPEPNEGRTTPEDNGTREAQSGGEQTRRILLEINGSGAIDIGRNSPEEVLAIMQTHLKPCMMSILKTEIYEEGDASYDF